MCRMLHIYSHFVLTEEHITLLGGNINVFTLDLKGAGTPESIQVVYSYPSRQGGQTHFRSWYLDVTLILEWVPRVGLNSWSIERGGLRGLTNDH